MDESSLFFITNEIVNAVTMLVDSKCLVSMLNIALCLEIKSKQVDDSSHKDILQDAAKLVREGKLL